MIADTRNNTVLLRLRVHPNAGRNEVLGFTDEELQVKIAAPPVKGKANRGLVDFLSQVLGVSKSSLAIVKGHTSRNKVISVTGLNREDIRSRLATKPSPSSDDATSK